MAKTITIIAYIASFLAGVFVTTLLSSLKLTSNDAIIESSMGMSDFIQTGSSVRGVVDANKFATNKDNDEEKDRLMKEIDDLHKTIENIQKSSENKFNLSFEASNRPSGFCSLLPQPTPSALSMWSSRLSQILDASQHPEDKNHVYNEFTKLLLHFMTPDRMQRGVKTLPLDWTPVEKGLDVMYKRFMFIQNEVDSYRKKNNLESDTDVPLNVLQDIQKSDKIPRPLHVVVMGGSVTVGVVCNINPVTKTGIARRSCAWPGRMNYFFTMLFGGYQLIQFHNVAMGGTNTESGITMWDYSLLPGETPYPDVVINAYATNDMHYNSVQSALAKNMTLEQSVIELNQVFIRQVLTPKRECGHTPPLLLYFDDYLGNEQNEVLTTMISSQAIHLLSGYYGLGSISYADSVRDIVYSDNKEWWYHANWFEKGTYERAVHPHMGMHITSSWIVAFYFINLAATYCSLPVKSDGTTTLHAGNEHDNSKTTLKGGPERKPRGLPPSLTTKLSLEHITERWSKEFQSTSYLWKNTTQCSAERKVADQGEKVEKPCMYSWVVGLERFLDKPKALTGKLNPQITLNEGWIAADDNNKLGWVPSGNGSKFTMEWKSVTQSVRALTLMIMRSYGDKWEGSKLKVEIWSKEKLMASDEIVGFHDKNTSETYNIKMQVGQISPKVQQPDVVVNEIPTGSDLRITFELVGGTTFKISGMAICDH